MARFAEWFLSMQEALTSIPSITQTGYGSGYLSSQYQGGGGGLQGHLQLHGAFQASPGYVRPDFKRKGRKVEGPRKQQLGVVVRTCGSTLCLLGKHSTTDYIPQPGLSLVVSHCFWK